MTGRLPEGQSEENMRQDEIIIRAMEIEDYDQVRSLWMTIRGFGIRSIDDSREEIARFLKGIRPPAWWRKRMAGS